METNPISRSISVFFPAFNDACAILPLILSALDVLPTLTDDYEVLVVNDGSTDATPAVLDELARASAHVKVVHHPRNLGYGATLRSGFKHATKELIFYTDGDGQYDVRELPALHRELTAAVDVVNGFKVKRADKRHRVLHLGAGGAHRAHHEFERRLHLRAIGVRRQELRRGQDRSYHLAATRVRPPS